MIDHLIPFNNEDDEGRPKNVGIRIVATENWVFRNAGSDSDISLRSCRTRRKRAGRSPDCSFGWLGPYGSQVWINPKQQLVTILMIQNSVNAVQRDFEAAVVQARLNQ